MYTNTLDIMEKNFSITCKAIYIEITSICNLRCKHCYNRTNDKYILNIKELKKIVDEMVSIKCYKIFISGGEPFTSPFIWELLEYCNKYDMEIVVITNGTMLTDEIISRLKEMQKVTLQISLDGSSEKENDNIRGNGVFKSVITNLLSLKNNNINVVVNFVLMKNNHDNLESLIEILYSLGIKKVMFKYLNKIGNAIENYNKICLDSDSYKNAIAVIDKIIDKKYQNMDISLAKYNSYCNLILTNDGNYKITPRISFRGEVFVCQKFNDSVFKIGNIKYQTFSSIFCGKRLYEMINLIKCSQLFNKKCDSCDYFYICGKICPADILQNGFLDYSDDYCKNRINEIFKR